MFVTAILNLTALISPIQGNYLNDKQKGNKK